MKACCAVFLLSCLLISSVGFADDACKAHSLMPTDPNVSAELERSMDEYGFSRPDRSNVDPTRPWRCGPPNYDASDLLYFQGRTKNHSAGTAASVVENLVKTWEMEASHLSFADWRTVSQERYRISANGQSAAVGEDAALNGNYNALLNGVVSEELYASNHTFDSSHALFREAFPKGFAWELVEVLAGPPRVVFSWRHWAIFDGKYRGRQGDGKLYEMYGLASCTVDENTLITDIEVYYKPEDFLRALQGELEPETLSKGQSIFGMGLPIIESGKWCPESGKWKSTRS